MEKSTMKRFAWAFSAAAVVAVVLAGGVTAQDAKKAESGPPLPKPGPEHEILKKGIGTWDATVESRGDPNGPVETTKGVEVNRMMKGGLWLIQSFQGEFGGQPFEGHGVMGYDQAKKKYVGVWIDSIMPTISHLEGDYDAAKDVMTCTMDMTDPSGKTTVKTTLVTEHKSDGTRVFTLSAPGPDGKAFAMMKITYKKRQLAAPKPARP
jgi:hypothetical protein